MKQTNLSLNRKKTRYHTLHALDWLSDYRLLAWPWLAIRIFRLPLSKSELGCFRDVNSFFSRLRLNSASLRANSSVYENLVTSAAATAHHGLQGKDLGIPSSEPSRAERCRTWRCQINKWKSCVLHWFKWEVYRFSPQSWQHQPCRSVMKQSEPLRAELAMDKNGREEKMAFSIFFSFSSSSFFYILSSLRRLPLLPLLCCLLLDQPTSIAHQRTSPQSFLFARRAL